MDDSKKRKSDSLETSSPSKRSHTEFTNDEFRSSSARYKDFKIPFGELDKNDFEEIILSSSFHAKAKTFAEGEQKTSQIEDLISIFNAARQKPTYSALDMNLFVRTLATCFNKSQLANFYKQVFPNGGKAICALVRAPIILVHNENIPAIVFDSAKYETATAPEPKIQTHPLDDPLGPPDNNINLLRQQAEEEDRRSQDLGKKKKEEEEQVKKQQSIRAKEKEKLIQQRKKIEEELAKIEAEQKISPISPNHGNPSPYQLASGLKRGNNKF